MELKLRKRIKNRLPGFEGGTEPASGAVSGGGSMSFAAKASPWVAAAEYTLSGIAGGIGEIANTRPSNLRADAGVSLSQVNGIAYLKENEIDLDLANKDYNKKMGMSFLTNPFKGLTMLFGRRKARRNMRRARALQEAVNDMARASASSDYLQQEYASEYGDPQDQILYAKNGKDAVQSAYGEIDVAPNSKTESGEVIYNAQQQTAHIVPGKAKGDTNLSAINPSDTIITNKFGLALKVRPAAKALQSLNKQKKNRGMLGAQTDNLVRKLATSLLNEAAEELAQMRQMGMLKQSQYRKYRWGEDGMWYPDNNPYKIFSREDMAQRQFNPLYWDINDKPIGKPAELPTINPKPLKITVPNQKGKKDDSTRKFPSNWWIDGLGAITGAGQMIADALQKTKKPNTYAQNTYGRYALNKLFGLGINPYPIMKNVYDQDRRNKYAINRSGGLSGALKEFANIASGIGTQNTIAEALADIQKQNNAYKSQAANAAINLGEQDRNARMDSNRWDLDYYSKSHGAKQYMMQQDLYSMLAALQQGYANNYKRYTFDRTMDLYNKDWA